MTSTKKTRLALIPDTRSKILYLSTLIDEKSVIELIQSELKVRLQRDLLSFGSSHPPLQRATEERDGEIDLFCEDIIGGIHTILREYQKCG